jgi:hypothetical protein
VRIYAFFIVVVGKEIFKDIPGQVSYIDDLLIYGKTQEEHDRNLKRVLERAKQANVSPHRTDEGVTEPNHD